MALRDGTLCAMVPVMASATTDESGPRVGLFATCLVDLLRPTVGYAALKLLRDAGCRVEVPRAQTCCGQPALNSGDKRTAAAIARSVIRAFEGYDYVVAPSGSCAATLARDVPDLLAEDPDWAERAAVFGGRCHELVSFLVDVMGMEKVSARLAAVATYHDSCSGLRTLGVKAQPRKLLASVEGLELRALPDSEICCGFGGLFCVKYPEISNGMVEAKARAAESTGAELLLGGDLGCLLNMAGKLKRRGATIQLRHVAEVLAGMEAVAAIGEDREP